ncbi:putative bifunctional diguanylate cyclase/phosphodiesterase [Crenobacter intestini]|uniref:EAL domain-containing protein n=1 Tax=Crenobacter intestini TaxID=2563443 RepID=A0A4V4N877_9NEIS|nr:EAL domain-containing protein [Crenobacter intestini]TIC83423.1 EAL domain-containing protein [Crenobacter intestini]
MSDSKLPDRLQRQLIRRFSLLMLGLSFALVVGCVFVVRVQLQTTAAVLQVAASEKVGLLLDAEANRLSSLARDYGRWDETYRYVERPEPDFVYENFGSSYQGLDIDVTAILDADGRELFHSGWPPRARLPSGLRRQLAEQFSEAQRSPASEPRHYLVLFDGVPLLLTATAVTDTEAERPANGLLLMGRFFNQEYLSRLSGLAGGELRFAPADAVRPPVSWTLAQAVVPLSGDLDGRVLLLQTPVPLGWLPTALLLFAGSLLLCIAVSAWWMRRFLSERVVSRIGRFAELARLRKAGNLSAWPVDGNDEIDALAVAYNALGEEASEARQGLARLEVTDPLTGVGNRRALEQALDALCAAQPAKACLLLLNLDGFKLVNDSLGHGAGDQLLKEAAQRLYQVLEVPAALHRLGSDEFAVVLPTCTPMAARALALRLQAVLGGKFSFSGRQLSLSASAGVAAYQAGLSGADLLRHADLALASAKARGRGEVAAFEPTMHDSVSERIRLEQGLRAAIAAGAITPYFQPVVDAGTRRPYALELLARWQFEGRTVAPLTFIRLAEELGLIGQLTDALLARALPQFAALRARTPGLRLQFNLSALMLSDSGFADRLLALLLACGVPAEAVSAEVTETAAQQEQGDELLGRLVGAGIGLHLDDFGTGYSSMTRLSELPFDTVKLDRSFVVLLGEGNETLARAVHDMATGMGKALIAEGVETEAQCAALSRLGYCRMQGYLFARPMPADALERWLAEGVCRV